MFKQTLKLRASSYLTTLQAKKSKGTSAKQTLHPSKETPADVPPLKTSIPKKWDLFSAVYLERHPVILKPMTEIEKRYSEMLQTVEYERSHLSNHEIRQKADKVFAQKDIDTLHIADMSQQTAQDFEDASMLELNSFQFAPTITVSDKSGDLTSLNRKLDSCLVLLTKHKYTKPVFIPPQGPRLEGETMRQAAERVLEDACGSDLKAKFYGNAPVGFYQYCYPRVMRENGSYGAKVFYYMARYISGRPQGKDHLWLDRQELAENLPRNIHKCVSQFIIST